MRLGELPATQAQLDFLNKGGRCGEVCDFFDGGVFFVSHTTPNRISFPLGRVRPRPYGTTGDKAGTMRGVWASPAGITLGT